MKPLSPVDRPFIVPPVKSLSDSESYFGSKEQYDIVAIPNFPSFPKK